MRCNAARTNPRQAAPGSPPGDTAESPASGHLSTGVAVPGDPRGGGTPLALRRSGGGKAAGERSRAEASPSSSAARLTEEASGGAESPLRRPPAPSGNLPKQIPSSRQAHEGAEEEAGSAGRSRLPSSLATTEKLTPVTGIARRRVPGGSHGTVPSRRPVRGPRRFRAPPERHESSPRET
jgi:hypothetical protein